MTHNNNNNNNHYFAWRAATCAALLLTAAACSNELEVPDATDPAATPGEQVTLIANLGGDDPQTRIGYEDTQMRGVKLTWSEGDQFIAHLNFDKTFIPELFTLKGEGGSASGSFEGKLPSMPDRGGIQIFYPATNLFKDSQNKDQLSVTTIGQTQTGNGTTDHLSDYNFMYYSIPTTTSPIKFTHATTMMYFDVTLDGYDAATDGAPTKLTLSIKNPPGSTERNFWNVWGIDGSLPNYSKSNSVDLLLRDITLNTGDKLKAYMMIINSGEFDIPADNKLVVSVTCANGAVYQYEPASSKYGKNFSNGNCYRAICTLTKTVDANPSLIFDNDTEASASLSGSGTSAEPFLIKSASDLKKLVDPTVGGSNSFNKYFRLDADICVKADEWTPIGGTGSFQGKFDGNGHIISGKLTGSASNNFGFFGNINKAEIRNLHITAAVSNSCEASMAMSTGALAGAASGKIIDCTNSGTVSVAATVPGYHSYTGGIIGSLSGSIENCINRGKVIGQNSNNFNGTSASGGIAGTLNNNSSLLNCRNYGEVTADEDGTHMYLHMGGLVGETGNATLTDCINYGTIKAAVGQKMQNRSGGLIGNLKITEQSMFAMHTCINKGIVEPPTSSDVNTKQYVGGIIGHLFFDIQVVDKNASCVIANCCVDTGSGLDYLCGNSITGSGTPVDYTLQECSEGHIKRDNGKPFLKE